MRWTEPEYGDTRIRRKFAFLPCRCRTGMYVWLENVMFHQTYYGDFAGWQNDYIIENK